MRDKFSGSGNTSGLAFVWKNSKSISGILEYHIHFQRCLDIIPSDELDD